MHKHFKTKNLPLMLLKNKNITGFIVHIRYPYCTPHEEFFSPGTDSAPESPSLRRKSPALCHTAPQTGTRQLPVDKRKSQALEYLAYLRNSRDMSPRKPMDEK